MRRECLFRRPAASWMRELVKVFVSSSDPEFQARVRAVSDRLEVVTPEDLRREPDLVEEVEIVYGGLGRDQLPRARRLRWLQTAGAGVNGVLIPEIRDGEVIVTNTRGMHAHSVTEHMFGMLLMVTRRLGEAWDQQKTRQWRGYDFAANLGTLAGKTLGLLGVGAIGAQSARVGKAFGMRVIGLRRTGEPHPDVERMYGEEERLEFFREADIVMNILPLTDRTRRSVGRSEFAAMKPGAVFLNAGRGGTVDTEALVAALRDGRPGAALLDVTDPEPLPEDHPLWAMENVFITPHYGGSQPGYQDRAGAIFLENLSRFVNGEPMLNVVDKHEGY